MSPENWIVCRKCKRATVRVWKHKIGGESKPIRLCPICKARHPSEDIVSLREIPESQWPEYGYFEMKKE